MILCLSAILRLARTVAGSFFVGISLQSHFVSFTLVALLDKIAYSQARQASIVREIGAATWGRVYATTPVCGPFSAHCLPWVAAGGGTSFFSPSACSCGARCS